MKQLYTYIALAMMALTALTSCERNEDRREASVLEGTWTGQIQTYYYDRWGLTGDRYRTTMYFARENPYGGWGYEVDYDVYSRYDDYYYCEFDWEVYNGSIRIRYDDSWNDVLICDYTLSTRYFDGYMDDGTSKDIVFHLTYDDRFDWGYWQSGYTRSAGERPKSVASGVFSRAQKESE